MTPHQAPVACAAAADLAGAGGGWTAQQLASTYGLSTLYQQGRFGAGQRVGIYELEPFTPSDIATYQSCYGSDASVSTVDVDGGATGSQTRRSGPRHRGGGRARSAGVDHRLLRSQRRYRTVRHL